jgi:hypothetical protein
MNIRFIVFLIIVVILVAWAVIYELNREQPWDSDVFFSELNYQSPTLESAHRRTVS